MTRFDAVRGLHGHGHSIAETDLLPGGHWRLLETFELLALLRLPRALGPAVQPETRRPQGLEYLRPLLRAAQAGQVVDFAYQKFWEDAPERRTAGPLLLKEFRGRWYVLAVMVDSGRLACFGLDRISDFSVTAQRFAPPVGFDARTYFADCFGITRPTDGQLPEEILLRFEPVQGRYALSYPLHSSQQVVLENEAEIRLRLTVYDTYELRMELLSYGPDVEVLAPIGLRDWLRRQHTAAAGPRR